MPDLSDPYAPFLPRRARIVSSIAALGIVLVFAIVGINVPQGGSAGWTGFDSVMLIAVGVAIAAFLLRYAMVGAWPDEQGLRVRNLLITRRLDWAQIVAVQYGGGQPWAVLDLADTEQLAVMAIQRSDGPVAMREAQRLAALIAAHGGPAAHE
ncbi:PH domain-containing protein [Branchiibius cervicis]|uniref:PH domain-containing protein n=1 Tax=Branchiibius cervicis TaxID=908252 RepID=A0ABW2ASL5_9MICO